MLCDIDIYTNCPMHFGRLASPKTQKWVGKLEMEQNWWCGPNAIRLNHKEEPLFQVKSKVKKKLMFQFEIIRPKRFLLMQQSSPFCPVRPSADQRGHLQEAGPYALLSLPRRMSSSSRNIFRKLSNNVWPIIRAAHGPAKLTMKLPYSLNTWWVKRQKQEVHRKRWNL